MRRDAERRVRLAMLCSDWAALDHAVGDAFKAIQMTALKVEGAWRISCGVHSCGGHRLALVESKAWAIDEWFSGSFEAAIERLNQHRWVRSRRCLM